MNVTIFPFFDTDASPTFGVDLLFMVLVIPGPIHVNFHVSVILYVVIRVYTLNNFPFHFVRKGEFVLQM